MIKELLAFLQPEGIKYGLIGCLLVVYVISDLYVKVILQAKMMKVVDNNTRALAKVETSLLFINKRAKRKRVVHHE